MSPKGVHSLASLPRLPQQMFTPGAAVKVSCRGGRRGFNCVGDVVAAAVAVAVTRVVYVGISFTI